MAAGRSARPCQAAGGCGSGRGHRPEAQALASLVRPPATRPWAFLKGLWSSRRFAILNRLDFLGDGALLRDGGRIGD